MLGEIIGSLIGAGSQIATNAFNLDMMRENNQFQAELARSNADREYAYNQKLYKQQNEYNLDMWNRQNEYNSPQAQMERLASAGLNPNLAYGSLSEGNAGAVQTANMPAYQIDQAHTQAFQAVNPFGALIQSLSTLENLKSISADTRKKEAEADRIESLLPLEVESSHFKNRKDYFDVKHQDERYMWEIESIVENLNYIQHQSDLVKVREQLEQANLVLKNFDIDVMNRDSDMRQLGLNPGNEREKLFYSLAVILENVLNLPILDTLRQRMVVHSR